MGDELSRREVLAAGAALAGSYVSPAKAARGEAAMDGDATLRELLARNRGMHPIYRGGLANHLSMELCALAGLGATSERMSVFSASYSRRLDPFPAEGRAVSKDTWRQHLGQGDALHGFTRYFAGDLRERGREVVLRDVLATFAPSVSSELFHCLIRTAYGARFDDDEEIAHGLAYWSIRPQPLGPLAPEAGQEREFAALLARVRETPGLAKAELRGNSNPGRMKQVSRLAGFPEVVNALEVDEGTLDRMARAVLDLYVSTRDFTALHAVTSTHALGILLPYFPDRELALRYHAQGLLAAYVRMGASEIVPQSAADAPSWDAIATKAIASEDDHDAKFVYACREGQSARGDALYRRAAALRMQVA
jgi:hypothetical protein